MVKASVIVTLATCLVVACSSAGGDDASTSNSADTETVARSFATHPAIVETDAADQLYALSDVHGDYDGLVRLLAANHLIASAGSDPTKLEWSGGTATLVIAGDLIDKGPESLAVIDAARALETQAPLAGGRVIAMMGNHEAEFLADPKNDKATSSGEDEAGIDGELKAENIDPKALAAGTDRAGRGRWLAGLPIGVRVKKWFFAHGGNTQRLSIAELRKKLEDSIAHHGYADDDLTGAHSILEDQEWYGDPKDDNAGAKELAALGGVDHIVFGHDPSAFDDRGHIHSSKNGVLVKLDVAMGLHESHAANRGYLLHVSTKGEDVAEVLDDEGHASPLEH